MANRTKRTDRARESFVKTLAERCNVTAACKAAGIGRSTAYEWRDADPDFRAAWELAEEIAVDALHEEAWRRAVDGWEEPVYYMGEEIGTVRKYSDRMLELLLKGHRPDKFAPQATGLPAGTAVLVGLVVIGPGGEGPEVRPGDDARDITPNKLNGGNNGSSNGKAGA